MKSDVFPSVVKVMQASLEELDPQMVGCSLVVIGVRQDGSYDILTNNDDSLVCILKAALNRARLGHGQTVRDN